MEIVYQFLPMVTELLLKALWIVLIWVIGNWALGLIMAVVRRVDIPGTDLDDKVINKFAPIISVVWKVVLGIIILEQLNLGTIIVEALLSAMSFTIAIGLGLAFGEALKPHAKKIVKKLTT